MCFIVPPIQKNALHGDLYTVFIVIIVIGSHSWKIGSLHGVPIPVRFTYLPIFTTRSIVFTWMNLLAVLILFIIF